MNPKLTIPPELIDRFEDEHQLWGRRTRDIAPIARWRVEGRSRFHRLAEGCLALAVLSVLLAFAPTYPLQSLAIVGIFVNAWTMIYAETRAAIINRQLNRRAAEQLLRDLNGIGG